MTAAYQIFCLPSQQALDTAASVLSGATLTFSLTGTSTPTDAFSDPTLATPVANPLAADSAGVWIPIFLDPQVVYRVVLKTAAGAVLKTWDPANENVLNAALIGFLLYPRTAEEIAASITPVHYEREPYDVRRQGAVGNGSTNDGTAFAQEFSAASGREVTAKALTGTYRFSGSLATTGNVVLRGEGMLNGVPKTTLEFAATPGAAVGQFDMSAATTVADLTNLHIAHASQVPAAANGIGIKFPANAAFTSMDRVYVEYFDTGIQVNGHFYYRDLHNVFCLNNRTAGLEIAGNLWNGKPVFGGTFSRTTVGSGINAHGIGSHATFIGTYREGNAGGGASYDTFFMLTEIGNYNEQNGSAGPVATDVYMPNIYPHLTAHYIGIGNYHDVSADTSKPRIRATKTSLTLIGHKFFNAAATAPIRIDDLRGYQPAFYHGCEYAGPYLTTIGAAEQQSAVIIDSKHPTTFFSSGLPATGSNAHPGTVWINTNPALPLIRGYRCLTAGSLAGFPAIVTTAQTTAGSKTVTINDSSNGELFTGTYIKIAGTNFGGGSTFAMITECNSNGTIGLDKVADSSVGPGAVMSYPAATLETIYGSGVEGDRGDANITVVAGVDFPTQRYATALTANRTVTLSATNAAAGAKFRIVRTAVGAGTLDVGGLRTIPAATTGWVDVEHDGTSWRLTAWNP